MTQRTLIGIILDCSQSMRWNWQNSQGQALPQIQVIHDALLERLQGFQIPRKRTPPPKIDLFCLGAGFVRNFYYNEVETSTRAEKIKDETMRRGTMSDVVCDLLALADIIPTKHDIEYITDKLNQQWHTYANGIIQGIRIQENSYEQLERFLRSALATAATRRQRYRLPAIALAALTGLPIPNTRVTSHWKDQLQQREQKQHTYITTVVEQECTRIRQLVAEKAQAIVHTRKDDFANAITTALTTFLSDQTMIILDLLTVARSPTVVLEHFQQEQFQKLAYDIYNDLKVEVEREIGLSWKLLLTRSSKELLQIGGTVNHSLLQPLIEDCMRADVWHELRPFAEEVIQDLFVAIFTAQIKERISYWIGLAAAQEIIKPVHKISVILPETIDINLYSDEYMYGIAPIKEALDKCAIRFTQPEQQRKDKLLVIISDGEFEASNPLFDPKRVAEVLKKTGVRIVCLYVGKKDITRKGSTDLIASAPIGARILHAMSSPFQSDQPLEQALIKRGLAIPEHRKIFLQINKAEMLQNALEIILIHPDQTPYI